MLCLFVLWGFSLVTSYSGVKEEEEKRGTIASLFNTDRSGFYSVASLRLVRPTMTYGIFRSGVQHYTRASGHAGLEGLQVPSDEVE